MREEDKESLAERKLIDLLKGKALKEEEGHEMEHNALVEEYVKGEKVSISGWRKIPQKGVSFPFLKREKRPLVLGLDLGSCSVKAVGLEHRDDKLVLLGFSIVEILPEEGGIERDDRIAMVEDALRGLDKRAMRVVVSVSGITRQITMPRMSQEKLSSAIRWEASRYLPLEPDRFVIDYQVLDPNTRSRTMNVLLAAVEKERVGELESILEVVGLTPDIMDLDLLAMANSILSSAEVSISDVIAMLDIGASGTRLCITGADIPLFTRGIPIGGIDIAQAVWKFLGKKVPLSVIAGDKEMVIKAFEAIKGVLEDIVVEVRKAFIYYDTQVSRSITRIFLSGGIAMFPGVEGYILSSLGIPVEVANPLKGLEIPEGEFDKDLLERVAPRLSVACGLAMRRV